MLDLVEDQDLLFAKSATRLAQYARSLVQARENGADEQCWVELGLSLAVGVLVVKEALPADIARTSDIVGFLVEYHELNPVASSPYNPIATTIVTPGAGGPVYRADLLGPVVSDQPLINYLDARFAGKQNTLIEGEGITLTDNGNGTTTVAVSGDTPGTAIDPYNVPLTVREYIVNRPEGSWFGPNGGEPVYLRDPLPNGALVGHDWDDPDTNINYLIRPVAFSDQTRVVCRRMLLFAPAP